MPPRWPPTPEHPQRPPLQLQHLPQPALPPLADADAAPPTAAAAAASAARPPPASHAPAPPAPPAPPPPPPPPPAGVLALPVSSPLPLADPDDLAQVATCRICCDLIKEAFVTKCGHSFCRACIFEQLEHRPRCPLCGARIDPSLVFPNFALNRLITNAQAAHGSASSMSSPALLPADIDAMVSALLLKKRQLESADRSLRLELLSDFLRLTLEEKQLALARLTMQMRCLSEDIASVQRLLAPQRDDPEAASDLDLPVPLARDDTDPRKRPEPQSPRGAGNAQVPDGPGPASRLPRPLQLDALASPAPAPSSPASRVLAFASAVAASVVSSVSSPHQRSQQQTQQTLQPQQQQPQQQQPQQQQPQQQPHQQPQPAAGSATPATPAPALPPQPVPPPTRLSAALDLAIPAASDDPDADTSLLAHSAHDMHLLARRGHKRSHSLTDSPPVGASKPAPADEPADASLQRLPKLRAHMDDLQSHYFDWRLNAARASPSDYDDLPVELSAFSSSLAKFSKYSDFRTISMLRYIDNVGSHSASIVSSIEFDKDDEFFAAAGVSKKIKVFEFASVVADTRHLLPGSGFISRTARHMRAVKRIRSRYLGADPDVPHALDISADSGPAGRDPVSASATAGARPGTAAASSSSALDQVAAYEHLDDSAYDLDRASRYESMARYPVREMPWRSKISCLSYNPYIKPYLLASDYEGMVTLWDSSVGVALSSYEEHEKRIWSVDFSHVDPMRMASGGDDTRVKIWTVNVRRSVATIESKANICSVRFHPTVSYHLAFGSADHHVHYYDLRNTSVPLHVFKGHRKAVSYVKFVNAGEMISASTDCSLRLWSLKDSLAGSAPLDTRGRPQSVCLRTFTGHTNEKNFVGLSINSDGEFIACGSETNEVYTYFSKLSRPIVKYHFGNGIDAITGEEPLNPDPAQFVSSLCWKRKSPNILIAANSHGRVKVMEMV